MESTYRVANCSDYQFTSIVTLVFQSVAVRHVVPTIKAVKSEHNKEKTLRQPGERLE